MYRTAKLSRTGEPVSQNPAPTCDRLKTEPRRGPSPVVRPVLVTAVIGAMVLSHSAFSQPAADRDLLLAAERGDSRRVEELLSKGTSPDVRDAKGQTPLMLAADKRQTAVIRILLEKGADVNATDKSGTTALVRGTFTEEPDIVKALLSKGADPNIAERSTLGMTPLMVAVAKGNRNVAEILLKNRADPNMKSKDGDTALHFAVIDNDTAMARLLISNGADTNARNNNGNTALRIAGGKGFRDLARILVEAGARQ